MITQFLFRALDRKAIWLVLFFVAVAVLVPIADLVVPENNPLHLPGLGSEPGLVSTHCPTRFCNCFCNSAVETANISTRTPGRPSGVCLGGRMLSTLASQPHPMTEVANPVIVVAACVAQRVVGAVITIAVARMPKASANVSSMTTPLSVSSGMRRSRRVSTAR